MPSTADADVRAPARRQARACDASFFAELYAACRAEELAATGWDEETVAAFCASQHDLRERWYASTFPAAHSWVLMADDEPAGRLLLDRRRGSVHVVDFAVHPRYQGRGLGGAVLRDLLATAPGPVRLTVRRDNPARRLYERLGFTVLADDDELDVTMQAVP